MMRLLCLWVASGLFLVPPLRLRAQAGEGSATAQADFALAAATAHIRTSLFVADSKPFAITATVKSGFALRGTGQGTYTNEWVDAQHWRRTLRFPDFQQSEMRNDAGHSWVEQSSDTIPLRIQEMLRVVVLHVPSSTAASHIPVSESTATGEGGEVLACYSASSPPPPDGFVRHARWCFDKTSGLLALEDMPLNTQIAYSGYVAFQGKQEFTHVRVTAGSLVVLDIDLAYKELDSHALEGDAPDATMHRSASAGAAPNPEELRRGSVEYSELPLLPAGTADAAKGKPVQMQFEVSAENKLVDAMVEDAPTQAMADAALLAARTSTFTPLMRDGQPVGNRFYHSVWFRSGAGAPSSSEVATAQQKGADEALSLSAATFKLSGFGGDPPSFVFRYPSGFEQIPRGAIEQAQSGTPGPHPGMTPGAGCDLLLFKAQRLGAGEVSPEVLSIVDLAPLCIAGVIDRQGLENTAVSTARSIVAQMAQGRVSKPSLYSVDGRTFAVVSARSISKDTMAQETDALVLVTRIHDHVVAWTILGPRVQALADTLRACTLQVGSEDENSLLTLSGTP